MELKNIKRVGHNNKIIDGKDNSSKVRNDELSSTYTDNGSSSASSTMSVEKSIKQKSKKKKFITVLLDIMIVLLLLVGIYLIVKPMIVAKKQDEVIANLAEILARQEGKETELSTPLDETSETTVPSSIVGDGIDGNGKWVDANINAIEGEELEDFGQDNDTAESTAKYFYLQPLGMIQIDSIDVNLPILKGASTVPLRYGAGWYESSAPIGKSGRATILGHAMNFNDRFFTKIHKLKPGENIRIITSNKRYVYRISEAKAVPDYELKNYLVNNDVPSQIMLVTCHNKPSWNQRFLVFAELIDIKDI